jgi:HEPN domain-containing protein
MTTKLPYKHPLKQFLKDCIINPMKQEAKRWLDKAESDMDASLYLYKGAKYPHAVYFICQAIEKLLKAAQIEVAGKAPQKIHRLENIAKMSGIKIPEEIYEKLTQLSKHYGRVRYPDISQVSYNTKAKASPIIENRKEAYQWILKNLPSR